MEILITGAAGFIGFHLAKKLLETGYKVTGLDNLNDYYSPRLKQDRLAQLQPMADSGQFVFYKTDLADSASLQNIFSSHKFTHVFNMAAQAGVRYSLQNPAAYISSNLTGFGNLLECSRKAGIAHLVYASSSSVYGLNKALPYSTSENTDHPMSLYAATKKSNELMAHAYSHLYGLATTGLRFFTVYGPWGRPDMAPHIFSQAILKGDPIKIFNHGHSRRDFTYIDDIVESTARLLDCPPAGNSGFDPLKPDPASSSAPWRIYNIGNDHTVGLEEFINALEAALGKKAIREYLPAQPGDMDSTWADVSDFYKTVQYKPATSLQSGLEKFVAWHKDYYKNG